MNDSTSSDDSRWLVVTNKVKIPLSEFSFTYSRSSGPGGQNVNKVNTKVQLRWPVISTTSLDEPVKARLLARARRRITSDGDLLMTSQRYRDQARNTTDCLEKLKELIAEAMVEPTKRKPTKVTAGARRRRLEGKRRQSQKKQLRRPPAAD